VTVRIDEGHERGDTGVTRHHEPEEPINLAGVPNELGSRPGLAASEPDTDRYSLGEIQLPLATCGSQQRVTVRDVAHRLEIGPPRLAAREREQHQLCIQGSPEGESQQKPHRNVDHTQDACSTAKVGGWARAAVSHNLILRVCLGGVIC
jgi:hypothetical protein